MLNRFDPLPGLYRRALLKRDYRNVQAASLVLVNSYFSAESVYRQYARRPHVCYLGVDSDEFKPDTFDGVRPFELLSVGALQPSKGFEFIVHALACLPVASRPSLTIASNTDNTLERGYLTDLAASKGVELNICTLVKEMDIIRFYNRAMLLAYAPVLEPLGLAALEAMACGLPVVGVFEGGVRETVEDGVTGILTDRDHEQFAQAIQCLVSQSDLRKEYGEAARKRVMQNWTWEASTRRIERMLEQTAFAGESPDNDRPDG